MKNLSSDDHDVTAFRIASVTNAKEKVLVINCEVSGEDRQEDKSGRVLMFCRPQASL
jgi:hypothetical protein